MVLDLSNVEPVEKLTDQRIKDQEIALIRFLGMKMFRDEEEELWAAQRLRELSKEKGKREDEAYIKYISNTGLD